MGYLIMRRGPMPGKLYPLLEERIKVGRGSKNHIVIDDNEVSREHLHLVRVPSGYELHDLNSSNGTFVNGHAVRDVWLLQSRCIIELGDSITFEYRTERPKEAGLVLEDTAPEAESNVSDPHLIVIVASQDQPTVYPLEDDEITIGRDMGNGIVIVEPEMSRQHLKLVRQGDRFTAEDMGSTNGTFINGEVLDTPRLLNSGDVLQVGTMVQMQFTLRPDKYLNQLKTGELSSVSLDPPTHTTHERRTTAMLSTPDIALGSNRQTTVVGTGLDQVKLADQVLVVYHRDDWQTVAGVVDGLQAAGIGVWVEQYLVPGTNDWRVATDQARLECWMMLLIVTAKSVESDDVRKNWLHFRNRDKPIAMLMCEPVERLPIGASKVTKVHYNPAVPDIALKQLTEAIERARPQI